MAVRLFWWFRLALPWPVAELESVRPSRTSAVQTTIEKLLLEVRQSVSSSSHLAVLALDRSGFTIQVGRSIEAVVTVTLHDAVTPSFSVTCPVLCVGRDGHEAVQEQTSVGLLSQGVVWIVRKVFRFGFVPPEGYRRPPQNAGVPQHP